jgi:NADPH:quinone reductase-like Zn-dependent oxidoreductase
MLAVLALERGGVTPGSGDVLVTGAAGGVGSIAIQLARAAGARVIATGRTDHRDVALDLGAHAFVDLGTTPLSDAGEVDVVLDVLGGDVLEQSAALVRPGGTLVSIATPPVTHPKDGRAVFFVVEPDRTRLADLAQRVQDGRLRPIVGAVHPLSEAVDAFLHPRHVPGRTIIQIASDS